MCRNTHNKYAGEWCECVFAFNHYLLLWLLVFKLGQVKRGQGSLVNCELLVGKRNSLSALRPIQEFSLEHGIICNPTVLISAYWWNPLMLACVLDRVHVVVKWPFLAELFDFHFFFTILSLVSLEWGYHRFALVRSPIWLVIADFIWFNRFKSMISSVIDLHLGLLNLQICLVISDIPHVSYSLAYICVLLCSLLFGSVIRLMELHLLPAWLLKISDLVCFFNFKLTILV